MKRFLCIVIVLAVVVLSGCSSPAPELIKSFEADISTSIGASECKAHLTREPDKVTLEFTSPASLEGMIYAFDGEEFTSSLGDLSCVSAPDSLPPSALPRMICDAMYGLSGAALTSSQGDTYSYELKTASGRILISCVGGVPRGITCDYSPYIVTLRQTDPR